VRSDGCRYEIDPAVVGDASQTKSAIRRRSVDKRWALVFATNAWSFTAVENPLFRDLVQDLPSRRHLATLVDSVAQKLRRRALERVQNITLCIDGGKIHRPYLLMCASSVRGAFVVRVRREDSFTVDDGGAFCSANLALAGCAVVNVCADNASNMQAARSDEYTTLRCAAHVIQLVVKSTLELQGCEVYPGAPGCSHCDSCI
jgi:hypothetical protein